MQKCGKLRKINTHDNIDLSRVLTEYFDDFYRIKLFMQIFTNIYL